MRLIDYYVRNRIDLLWLICREGIHACTGPRQHAAFINGSTSNYNYYLIEGKTVYSSRGPFFPCRNAFSAN